MVLHTLVHSRLRMWCCLVTAHTLAARAENKSRWRSSVPAPQTVTFIALPTSAADSNISRAKESSMPLMLGWYCTALNFKGTNEAAR